MLEIADPVDEALTSRLAKAADAVHGAYTRPLLEDVDAQEVEHRRFVGLLRRSKRNKPRGNRADADAQVANADS